MAGGISARSNSSNPKLSLAETKSFLKKPPCTTQQLSISREKTVNMSSPRNQKNYERLSQFSITYCTDPIMCQQCSVMHHWISSLLNFTIHVENSQQICQWQGTLKFHKNRISRMLELHKVHWYNWYWCAKQDNYLLLETQLFSPSSRFGLSNPLPECLCHLLCLQNIHKSKDQCFEI